MEPELMEATPVAAVEEPLPESVSPEIPPTETDVSVSAEENLSAFEEVTNRLATEFLALAEEFPHLVSPTELPDSVLDTAAEEGIPLLDAYLRYRWQEEKKVATANATRRRAAASSTGSLSRGAIETPPEQDAFLRAFRSAL